MAPNDGSFSEVNTFPGGLSYYDVETAATVGGNPFFSMEPGANMPLTFEMQNSYREQVFAAFFRNVLNLPVDGPEMTATEVIQRKEEFIREVGPVFGRLESDYTAPVVERAFSVLLRAGAFPDVPGVLGGKNIRFRYESPVKKIRQQVDAAAARLWVQEHIEASINLQRPNLLDVVNFDAYSQFQAEANGVPYQIVNGREQVEAIRQARAEAQAQAQQAAALQQAAEIADKGAGALNKAGLVGQAA